MTAIIGIRKKSCQQLSRGCRPRGRLERVNDMKKRLTISIPMVLFWLLAGVFVLSVCGNIIQFQSAHREKPLELTGSYCTNASAPFGVYMVFDQKGHYCKYTQTEGLLEEGDYAEGMLQTEAAFNGRQYYQLQEKSGEQKQVILVEDGVYDVAEDGSVEFYSRFSDVPTYFGGWNKELQDAS